MGTRINAFAVDVAAFGQLLDRPLWCIVTELRLAPVDGGVLFYGGHHLKKRFMVTPDRRIILLEGRGPAVPFTDEQLAGCDDLQLTTREYLKSESTYSLAWLLRGLAALDRVRGVREVTDGYGPWWIGSLLDGAERLWHATPPFLELAGYLARMLCGRYCGFPIAPQGIMPLPGVFPVLPAQDAADYSMAALNIDECRRFVDLLDMLMQAQPAFGLPPLDKDMESSTDWTAWVCKMVAEFQMIPKFGLPNTHLVSFIG